MLERERSEILDEIRRFARGIYEQLVGHEFPRVSIPDRSTSNIIFDPQKRHYVLGPKRTVRRADNVKHIRSFTNLVWVAYYVHNLVKAGKSSTLRDVYYSAEAFDIKFKSQDESDEAISDFEAILNIPRERLGIFPEERSAIFGDLTIEYTCAGYEGQRLNLTSHPDGVMIGPALATSNFVSTSAERVIVIETGGMFTRFVEERVDKKYRAILIHTAGQPPRATRFLIRRLNKELNLPVYIFTDGDPYGAHIAQVIISGSANSAHIPDLATPDAKWLGVWATDIKRYKLPSDSLTSKDVERLHQMMRDPRYQSSFWQEQLETFLELKRKAEQQSFSRYGLTYVVDKYLPEKIRELERG